MLCYTLMAASIINCFAASSHIAGTVKTNFMSDSSILRVLEINRCISSLRHLIPKAIMSIAFFSLPVMSSISVSLDRFCENVKGCKINVCVYFFEQWQTQRINNCSTPYICLWSCHLTFACKCNRMYPVAIFNKSAAPYENSIQSAIRINTDIRLDYFSHTKQYTKRSDSQWKQSFRRKRYYSRTCRILR